MAEDPEKKDEEKFEFTAEGEALGYISLDQAQVLAIRTARENTRFYTPARAGTTYVWAWIRLAWEVIRREEGEDYYYVTLGFRPSGKFLGQPGVEQFIIDKIGNVEQRQVLDEPSSLGTCPRCGRADIRPRVQRHLVNKWRCRGCNKVFARPKNPSRNPRG